MRIKLTAFLRTGLTILIIISGGAPPEAWADESVQLLLQITGNHNSAAVTDFDIRTNIGSNYGVFDTFHLEKTFSSGGAFAYYDLERNIVGGQVYHTLHISGAAINSGYENFSGGAGAVADSATDIGEDMMIQYVPDSLTDTPPTAVSFQTSYLLQGQLQIEDDAWTCDANEFRMSVGGDAPANYTVSISSNIVSSITTVGLNSGFNLFSAIDAGVGWDNFFGYPSSLNPQPGNRSSFDLRFYFQGYVNIVDQNGQPIPASKLKFLCVNPNDTTQQVPFASQPDLAIEQAITLEAVPSTNNLILQWPSYASSYQLQMTPSLGNAAWNTNGLPPPVVSGPFLQVTVPATNAAAFFRLRQPN